MDVTEQRVLDDLRLSPTAMVVCLRLRQWPRDTAVPATALAELVGVNPGTIRAALTQLEGAGWIETDRPRSAGRFAAPYIHVFDTPRHTRPIK